MNTENSTSNKHKYVHFGNTRNLSNELIEVFSVNYALPIFHLNLKLLCDVRLNYFLKLVYVFFINLVVNMNLQ